MEELSEYQSTAVYTLHMPNYLFNTIMYPLENNWQRSLSSRAIE